MICCQFFFSVTAQQKRALIIGINQYFLEQGKPNPSVSLKGAVNDARLIKGILQTRFSFSITEIRELYNESATRKNILSALNDLLADSKKGDIAFIYYSGHGMLMKNSLSDKNFIRDGETLIGHNQGILACDLFDKTSSLIRDHEISRIANRFIDKGVVLTMIFDCCYSESLLRGIGDDADKKWDMDGIAYEEDVGKFLEFDWPDQQHTPAFDENGNMTIDTIVIESRNIPSDTDLRDPSRIVKPAERPNSRFLYYAAASGVDKSYERNNYSNIKHGIFTQALCDVLKEIPVNSSLSVIEKKLQYKLQKEQFISPSKQFPSYLADPQRKNMNLLALPASKLRQTTQVNCLQVVNNDVIVNGGASVGLAKGNVLRLAKNGRTVDLRITQLIGLDSARASLISGSMSLLKSGSLLTVADWHTESDPLIRLYIPDDTCSFVRWHRFFADQIKPLGNNPKVVWYDKPDLDCVQLYCSGNDFYVNDISPAKKYPLSSLNSQQIEQLIFGKRFFINLPMPTELLKKVKNFLSKDQNVKLVNDIYSANAYLYCSYSYVDDLLVFTLSNDLLLSPKVMQASAYSGKHRLSDVFAEISPATFNAAAVDKLSDDIRNVILGYTSKGRWLNTWPKR
jgi:hypothetical protein